MVNISRFELREEVLHKLFDLFFEIVGKKSSKEKFNKVIYDLLSPVERIMIAKRIAIIYLILKKIDYRIICKTLKVSSATVAKFRLLSDRSEGIVPEFKYILRDEKLKLFLEDIYTTLFSPGVPGINWSSAWKQKLKLERKKETGI